MNLTARRVRINSFLCPSDANPGHPTEAGSNYPNNLGNQRYYTGWRNNGPGYFMGTDGGLNTVVSFAAITDGLSNTAIFSEWVKGKGGRRQDGLALVYGAPFGRAQLPQSHDPFDADFQAAQACQAAPLAAQGGANWDFKGEYWIIHDAARGGGYSHVQTPNRKACWYHSGTSTCGIGCQADTMASASSNHPGGVNVCFLDGSVRFVKNTVNRQTWRAISTHDSDELISDDQL